MRKLSKKTLFIVGKYVATYKKGNVWDFMGIFEHEDDAVANCLSPDCFIGPAPINEGLPLERSDEWPGLYFPLTPS